MTNEGKTRNQEGRSRPQAPRSVESGPSPAGRPDAAGRQATSTSTAAEGGFAAQEAMRRVSCQRSVAATSPLPLPSTPAAPVLTQGSAQVGHPAGVPAPAGTQVRFGGRACRDPGDRQGLLLPPGRTDSPKDGAEGTSKPRIQCQGPGRVPLPCPPEPSGHQGSPAGNAVWSREWLHCSQEGLVEKVPSKARTCHQGHRRAPAPHALPQHQPNPRKEQLRGTQEEGERHTPVPWTPQGEDAGAAGSKSAGLSHTSPRVALICVLSP